VTHQHIRRFDVGGDQEPLQIVDLILGVVHPGHWRAVAQPGAIVGTGPGRPTEVGLHIAPVPTVAGEPGFQHNGGIARAHALQVEAAAATNTDESARTLADRNRARRLRRCTALPVPATPPGESEGQKDRELQRATTQY
jgi:hypothetical protein